MRVSEFENQVSPLFPDLRVGVVRLPHPFDRVKCPHCQGWGVLNLTDLDDGTEWTTECGVCEGGKVLRHEAEAYRGRT